MDIAPDPTAPDLNVIARSGIDALRRRDLAAARAAFDQVVDAGRASPQLWLLLAQTCEQQGDDDAALAALDEVIGGDPANPYAYAMKGELFTRAGDDRAAVGWYEGALNAAARLAQIPPDLVERLARAKAAKDAAAGRFLATLHDGIAAAGIEPAAVSPRFAESLAIITGASKPYPQAPTNFYFPGLAAIPFFDTAGLAWVAALEAAYPAIRAECEAVLAGTAGLEPYVRPDENRPSRDHALLNDPNWSAFHLLQNGAPVPGNADRCPATMTALNACPLPHIRGRAPMALFSILRAGTHIPPHNGMLNTRLICHLPLIVPPGCRLRVGGETRTVEAGKALLFDDSIEHEAWNDSDQPRAILLFEVWRPDLTEAERRALTAMFETITDYGVE